MEIQNFIIGGTFLISLMSAAILFSTLIKNEFLRDMHLTAVISICASSLIGIIPAAVFFWYPFDFVADISLQRYLLSLSGIFLIICASFKDSKYLMPLAVLAASAVSVFSADVEFDFISQYHLLNKAAAIFALWVFACGWRSVSGLNPLPQIQGITVSLGIILLYIFGQAPFILCSASAAIFGALIIAYLYSRTQPLGIITSPSLGFLIGWLGLMCYNEYLLPCFAIFSMFYLCELLLSVARKITRLPQYMEIAHNSASVQSFSSGFPAAAIIRVIWNTNILMIILGQFQINGSNTYSIPLFSAIICAWQAYGLINWQTASKTLKETNQELIKGIKKSFSSLTSSDASDNNKTDKD